MTSVNQVIPGGFRCQRARKDWHWRVSRKRNVWKFNIAIEHVEIADLLIYLLKMVIFHSYISLPEGHIAMIHYDTMEINGFPDRKLSTHGGLFISIICELIHVLLISILGLPWLIIEKPQMEYQLADDGKHV